MNEKFAKIKSVEVDELFDTILKLKSREECYSFFSDLCSAAEIKSFGQRWLVAKSLDNGVTYQEIANEHISSSATISRVSRCLADPEGGYRMMLSRSKKNR